MSATETLHDVELRYAKQASPEEIADRLVALQRENEQLRDQLVVARYSAEALRRVVESDY